MSKRLLVAVFLACSHFILPLAAHAAPVVPSPQFPFTGRVSADHVNIRAGQSNNFESLGVAHKGDELVVVGKQYSWYKVRLPEGASLFVKMDYVKLLAVDVAQVTADRVNIRARANTTAAIVGQLVRGDQFFIKENKNDWLWIRPLAKANGWIREDFLEFKSSQVPSRPFADPSDAAARANADKEEARRKRAAKFAALTPVADGQYEAQGVLVKATIPQDGFDGFKLTVGSKDNELPVFLVGDHAFLDGFIGARVVVRGAPKDEPGRDAVTLAVTRIKLFL